MSPERRRLPRVGATPGSQARATPPGAAPHTRPPGSGVLGSSGAGAAPGAQRGGGAPTALALTFHACPEARLRGSLGSSGRWHRAAVTRQAQIRKAPEISRGGCAEAESSSTGRGELAPRGSQARPRGRARAPRLRSRPDPARGPVPRPRRTRRGARCYLREGGGWQPGVLAPVPSSPPVDTSHPRLPREALATTPTVFRGLVPLTP